MGLKLSFVMNFWSIFLILFLMNSLWISIRISLGKKEIQYLPKVWKHTREAYVKTRFLRRSQKSGFGRRALKFSEVQKFRFCSSRRYSLFLQNETKEKSWQHDGRERRGKRVQNNKSHFQFEIHCIKCFSKNLKMTIVKELTKLFPIHSLTSL